MKMISDILFLLYGAIGLFILILYKVTTGMWLEWLIIFSGGMFLFGGFYYMILKKENLTEW